MKRWLVSALGYVLLATAALAQGLTLPGPGLPHTSGGGGTVPAFIPSNSNHHENTAAGTTVAVALPATVVSGATCMGEVSYAGGAVPVPITDDKLNTYVNVDQTTLPSIGFTVTSFYLQNITNAPGTITAIIPNSPNGVMVVDCFSGIAATSPLDGHTIQNQNTSPGTGTDAVTSGPITTTANGDLLYAFSLDAASAGLTAGTNYTLHQANLTAYFTESSVQSVAGTAAGTFTQASNPAATFTTFVMAFKHQ